MVRYGTDETGNRRTANLLMTYRRWCPTYRRCGLYAIIFSSTSPCWLGTSQPTHCLCSTRKKEIKLNVIQCYAPTNDADEDKKDTFYQQQQDVIDSKGNKDITIVMGDFNAKIGADNTGYEDRMGTQGLGQMNENGELFADMCALNQLVMGGSIFPHKRIHKATWRSPDHVTENQIDHICINQRFRRSCKDVRVMRGAKEQMWLLITTWW